MAKVNSKRVNPFFFLLFLFCLLNITSLQANEPYQKVITQNPFSPKRNYEPPPNISEEKEGISKGPSWLKQLELKGTFEKNGEKYAIFHLSPYLQRKLNVTKSYLILKKGERLESCPILNIERDKVLLGGICQTELRLKPRSLPQSLSPPKTSKSFSPNLPPRSPLKSPKKP